MEEKYNKKRTNPPVWQHDYHVLKRLYQTLEKIVRIYLLNKDKLAVLDYGCGTSPYQSLFDHRGLTYTRADIDRNVRADFVVSEDEKLPLKDSSYDVILSTQVLEHIKNPHFYLNESKRLLIKDGLLVISTHGIWPYHAFPSDYNRWTKKGLEELVKSQGFKLMESYSILGPFASVVQFEMLIIAERLVRLKLLGRILLALLSVFGNALIWAEDKIAPPTQVSDSSLYVICAKKR